MLKLSSMLLVKRNSVQHWSSQYSGVNTSVYATLHKELIGRWMIYILAQTYKQSSRKKIGWHTRACFDSKFNHS